MASKVTVLVPTRERPDTLAKCLRTLTAQDYPDLEIIVSDNASGPATAEVVRALPDPRIRYVNTGKRLSMAHNFEFALSHATGDWITAVGDDDGLLPGGIAKAVAMTEASGLEAMGSEFAYFTWPGRGRHDGSILSVPMGRGASVRSARQSIVEVVNNRLGYHELPMLYTGGLIHRAVIERVKAKRGGSFYHCQIPDCYSALSVCSVVDKYLFSEEPFTIMGSSKHSTGGNMNNMKPTAFTTEGNIPLHADIDVLPERILTFSVPLLVYECYLQTMPLHGDCAAVDKAAQVETILNRTPVGHDILLDWAKAFCAKHGLDFARASAQRPPLHRRAMLGLQTAKNVMTRYRIGADLGLPIHDVYEASIVAGTILATRPSLNASRGRLIMRKFRKRTQPQAQEAAE